jgi:hypothetical protein
MVASSDNNIAIYLVLYFTKKPYHHAEDRGLVFEVFPSADRPPALPADP